MYKPRWAAFFNEKPIVLLSQLRLDHIHQARLA